MNYLNIPKDYPIKAELCTDPKLRIIDSVPCDYLQETVEYAVLRFLARCAKLYHYYANESCKLRFAKGREARRTKTLHCTAPAMLMELPGAWVRLTLRINREAIIVTAIELSDEYPKQQKR